MTGAVKAVTDFLDYNPPQVYEFSSCHEYSTANQEYWDNKFSNLGLAMGMLIGGASFYENIHNAPNLGIRTFRTIFDGTLITLAFKAFAYAGASLYRLGLQTICEEGSALYPSFQAFAEDQRNFHQNINPKA